MDESKAKADLQRYLRSARDALVWKLEGLGEYDARRPHTATGSNLLGLLKHAAGVELDYFGQVFGRPCPDAPAWVGAEGEPNHDMWATAEESRADILALAHTAWAHADATIAALPLDAVGRVPWWAEARREVTLHQILVHVIADLQRHAGHADILREGIDGAAGLQAGNDNLPPVDADWWAAYRERLERVAREAEAR
ncbi:DinB family protein [Streptomyces sp. NBRC 109706]|uniref:DinB family protein n=1 Tax=Streptomyces sp. NBRC 109706 TaxID=1550035 RepID=UPI0007802CED|nr:DinB family protein [Streptomyces sp. NBRC 109706]